MQEKENHLSKPAMKVQKGHPIQQEKHLPLE